MNIWVGQSSIVDEIIQSLRDTITTTIDTIISFIPDLIIGSIILLVGYIIAKTLQVIISKIVMKAGIDDKIESLGLTAGLRRVNIKQTPSFILGKLIFFTIFLNFLLSALEKMRLGDAILPLQQFIEKIPAMIAALITFILGTIIARFIGNIVSGALSGIGFEYHETFGNIVRGMMMCIVAIIALQQIGLDVDILTNLFLTTLIILTAGFALAFGLGGRPITRNALAGFYARESFSSGDTVLIDGKQGVITGIGTVNTTIATDVGSITIPNTRLTEDLVQKIL